MAAVGTTTETGGPCEDRQTVWSRDSTAAAKGLTVRGGFN